MKTTSEIIASFEAKRASTVAQAAALMTKANEEGSTLSAEDGEQHDNLQKEVDSIDKHLLRLQAQAKLEVEKAVPVSMAGNGTSNAGAEIRGGIVSVRDNLPAGFAFARYVKCMAGGHGNRSEALDIAKHLYPDMHKLHHILSPEVQYHLKTAVAGGTIGDATWAGPLVDYQNYAADFIEYLRPMSIIGKFGTNGIPALHQVPFNIQVQSQTSAGAGYWVGEGKAKPLTKFDFVNITMRWTKVANIAVLTDELVRFSSPSADMMVRRALSEALIARLDTDFVDPSKAAVTDVSPASITNGVTPIVPTGTNAAAVRTDVAALMAPFIAANLAPDNGVWIMSSTTALALSLMQNDLGQPEFGGLSMKGGTFLGMPVIVSQYVTNTTSGGAVVILANASDIYLADDGQVTIDASREASLQMDDAPTMSSVTGTGTSTVSMFQTNSVALRAERYINWKKRRSAAVQYLDGVHYAA
jgi:HK97 family phage major capsid protein